MSNEKTKIWYCKIKVNLDRLKVWECIFSIKKNYYSMLKA